MSNSNNSFALIGFPLGHTMSPQIHDALFKLASKNASYATLELAPENLSQEYTSLRKLSGYNVTIPHKIAIIPFLDGLDESAKRYGAVNCVKNGELAIGYNTDVIGFTRSISAMGANLSGKTLILGCGGVGRMMAIESALNGADLTIAVRQTDEDLQAAKKVKSYILQICPNTNVEITGLDNINNEFDLIINATPVGMYPNADVSPITKELAGKTRFLFDAIYNPMETMLMRHAKEQGAKVQGGMAMLVYQAVAAHEIWDNSSYNDKDIAELIDNMGNQLGRIFK